MHPAFRLSMLPPLGKVSETHLYDYLVDGYSGCDSGIQPEVAQRLIAVTGGDFEQTIDFIQDAQQGSWRNLLSKLRRSRVSFCQPMTNPSEFVTTDDPFRTAGTRRS